MDMTKEETREAASSVMRIALHLLTILEKCLPEDGDDLQNGTTRMAVAGMMVHVLLTTLPRGDTREGAMRHANKFAEIMLGGIEKHYASKENDDAVKGS